MAQKRTSGAAVTSLVLGLLSCIPVVGLVAVICGILGIVKTKDPRYTGRGLAIAGLLLGLVGLVGWGIAAGAGYGVWAYGKPAREAAKQYARDLSGGNVDAAMGNSTSTITRDELAAAADKMKSWGRLQDTTLPAVMMNKVSGSAETVDVIGTADFQSGGKVFYAAHMVRQAGQFKMDGFLFQKDQTTVTAGTAPKNTPSKGGASGGLSP